MYYIKVKLNNTSDFCSGDNFIYCHKPFYNFEGEFRFAPKYQLNVCALPKSMSTVLTAIVCFLYDTDRFIREGRSINKERWSIRMCAGKNEVYSIDELKAHKDSFYNQSEYGRWKHVAVVREPMERFVSGFLDRCILHESWKRDSSLCFGCKKDLTCFLENLDRTMANPKLRYHTEDTYHFFPQNWWCEMGKYMNNNFTVLKISRTNPDGFWDRFFDVLRDQKVPEELIEFINRQIHSGHTAHSTFDQAGAKQRLLEQLYEPYHMRLFLKMFYYDYVIFGFPLPKVNFNLR